MREFDVTERSKRFNRILKKYLQYGWKITININVIHVVVIRITLFGIISNGMIENHIVKKTKIVLKKH